MSEKTVLELVQEQGKAFDEFKTINEKASLEIRKLGETTAQTKEELARVNGDLDVKFRKLQQELAEMKRPGSSTIGTPAEIEDYAESLKEFIHFGRSQKNLDDLQRKALESKPMRGYGEQKALSGQSDADGGYFLTPQMDAEIDSYARPYASFASIAGHATIGTRVYQKLVKTQGVAGGFIGIEETNPTGDTQTPKWSMIDIPVGGIYAEPRIPNDLIEDSGYNLEADVFMDAGETFGEIEGGMFITGDGNKKARGILSYPIVANAQYTWGKVGYVASGASGDWAATNPSDKLIALQHSLKPQYRPNAVMLMADTTLAEVRQMKDGTGNFYLFNPEPKDGFAGQVLGSPVSIDDFMPAKGVDSYGIAFGDFKRAYRIVRRRGTTILRDNITLKGTTKFYMTRRVGGGVVHFEALKLLKFAAS